MTPRSILKSFCPPILLDAVRKPPPRPAVAAIPSYLGVSTIHSMANLHGGRFGRLYDRHVALDPSLDGNMTRLRVYLACFFASCSAHVSGDFLSAGISFGVAPRVIYDYLTFHKLGKRYHFVDPFEGHIADAGRQLYNTNPDFVRAQYPGYAPILIHQTKIPDGFPLPIGKLAFVHLNTGDGASEIKSLPYLYAHLSPGGFMVIDMYSSHHGRQGMYDPVIHDLGAEAFSMVTGQGIVFKA